VSDDLTIGGRPPHPPPRRLRLGADAWALLADALTRAGAQLPPPLRVEDGPQLDAAQRDAALQAMREPGLLEGDSGDLLVDLHPSLRQSLLAHVEPLVVVDSRVGLGDALRAARHAVRGNLASGLARAQRPADEERLELGPVELSTMLVDDLVEDVLRGFGDLGGAPDREPLLLDAAVSLAAVKALADRRPDLAQAVLEQPAVPAPLRELAAGLQTVAQVAVTGPAGTRVLVALRLPDGWWTAALSQAEVALRPVGEDEAATEIATAVAGAITSGRAA
jgi:hypothetical protein